MCKSLCHQESSIFGILGADTHALASSLRCSIFCIMWNTPLFAYFGQFLFIVGASMPSLCPPFRYAYEEKDVVVLVKELEDSPMKWYLTVTCMVDVCIVQEQH